MVIEIKKVGVFPAFADKVRFEEILVLPRDYVKGVYVLIGEDGRELVSGAVCMTHEQYVGWGTEDAYLEDCFLANLGLERTV